jgi:catechol 2,3-dioxygenase
MADRHDAEPAIPGSFGEPPTGYRLPDATRLGHAKLQVANLDRSVEWYGRVLGLRAAPYSGGATKLVAADDRLILELVERKDARPAGIDRRLGLFHFAILLPNRPSLAAFVQHLRDSGEDFAASDHLVSEAFYLSDPDGLGIEVYADRPRSSWRRVGRELVMGTESIDMGDLLNALREPWSGMPAGTTMGHMHLHVGEIAKAAEFYSETLGFDRIVLRYPGALFMSAGGYHHHLGTNTWAGPHAREPQEDDARLLEWNIVLPSASDVDAASASLGAGGYVAWREGAALVTRDPWGTSLRISAEG